MRSFLIVFVMLVSYVSSMAQNGVLDDMKITEEKLLASNKQLNQFIRRFNGEEDEQGNRLTSEDRRHRTTSLRKKFLPELIDQQSKGISEDVFKAFAEHVIDRKQPQYLDFHDQSWFAEVATVFYYQGKEYPMLLFMIIQQQGKGYEWVIEDVAFDPFKHMFDKDTTASKPFLHPMSHELQFMNLNKAFRENQNPESFTKDQYQPDLLTLFLYEMKKGTLKFKTVTGLKYHFLSIEGWYFELSNFNRPGYNTGWLISNLIRISSDQKQLLKKYIYDKR